MIYTIGHRPSYEQGLTEMPNIRKLGRREGYPGGSVWKTYEEAFEHAKTAPDYAVYGVLADWEKDTAPSGAPWHDLLFDRQIVKLKE
jgi:hypothetical protein